MRVRDETSCVSRGSDGSAVSRFSSLLGVAGRGRAARRDVEDWYLVEDWAALGALNHAAVTGTREAPHDQLAPRAVEGVGGIYGPTHGEPVASARYRLRVTKPLGAPHAQFEARLRDAAGLAAVIWKRQMVLGADHEFLIDSPTRPAHDTVLDQRIDVSALRAVSTLGPPET